MAKGKIRDESCWETRHIPLKSRPRLLGWQAVAALRNQQLMARLKNFVLQICRDVFVGRNSVKKGSWNLIQCQKLFENRLNFTAWWKNLCHKGQLSSAGTCGLTISYLMWRLYEGMISAGWMLNRSVTVCALISYHTTGFLYISLNWFSVAVGFVLVSCSMIFRLGQIEVDNGANVNNEMSK